MQLWGVKFLDIFLICTHVVSCLYTCASLESFPPPRPPKVFVAARRQLTLPWKPELLSAVHIRNICGCMENLLLLIKKWNLQVVCVCIERKSPKHFSIFSIKLPSPATHTNFFESSKSVCVNSRISIINRMPKIAYSFSTANVKLAKGTVIICT